MGEPLDISTVDGPMSPGVPYLRNPGLYTPTPDAFTSIIQDKGSYYTTRQFAVLMGLSDKMVHRWCQRWYGSLPVARQGKSMGYRIHPFMVRVARGWLTTEDKWMRAAILDAMRASARDWVVIVGKRATTHYTAEEALEAVRKVLMAKGNKPSISVLYVGDPNDEDGKE